MTEAKRTQPVTPEFVHIYIPGKTGTTLLLLHGTGGDENSLLQIAEMVDPNASILSVRGKVLENGVPRFFRRFAEGVFDIEDLKFRANELADFLVVASREYGFSLESLVAFGYSNGANIGGALVLLRPEVLGRAVLFRPTLPFVPEVTPKLGGKSVFISAGDRDSMTPRELTKKLGQLLESSGARVTTNWEDATHSLTQHDIEMARSWLGTPD